MPNKYFDKFPTIEYAGYKIRDITRSAMLVNKYTSLPYKFYRYEINEDQRPDQVADKYYSDPYMSWMVYYANKVVDPYYDWFLTEREFNEYLEKKYGSIAWTKKKILEFKTNWSNSEEELSPEGFEARFGEFKEPHTKYWNPNYDEDTGEIISYSRNIDNKSYNTNKVVKVRVSNNTPDKFEIGDLVDIRFAGNTVGTAEIIDSSEEFIHIQHVLGSIDNSYQIRSDANSSIFCTVEEYTNSFSSTANSWTITNISDEEYVYWEPWYVFEMEDEKNSAKRNIKLVDPTLANKLATKLEDELKDA